jgi:hypothetical protein
MSSNLNKRLVVRLSDDLEQWIGAQAELEGLDTATWVRSILTRMKNRLVPPVNAMGEEPLDLRPRYRDLGVANAEALATGYRDVGVVDADAMVAEALATADEQGLTAPRQDQEPEIPPSGVRSLVRRPPPFSTAHPGHIDN